MCGQIIAFFLISEIFSNGHFHFKNKYKDDLSEVLYIIDLLLSLTHHRSSVYCLLSLLFGFFEPHVVVLEIYLHGAVTNFSSLNI